MAANKDVQEATEELKKSTTAQVASDAASKASDVASAAKDVATPIVQAVGETIGAGTAKTAELLQKAAELITT